MLISTTPPATHRSPGTWVLSGGRPGRVWYRYRVLSRHHANEQLCCHGLTRPLRENGHHVSRFSLPQSMRPAGGLLRDTTGQHTGLALAATMVSGLAEQIAKPPDVDRITYHIIQPTSLLQHSSLHNGDLDSAPILAEGLHSDCVFFLGELQFASLIES